jgi:hypothetical protein
MRLVVCVKAIEHDAHLRTVAALRRRSEREPIRFIAVQRMRAGRWIMGREQDREIEGQTPVIFAREESRDSIRVEPGRFNFELDLERFAARAIDLREMRSIR